MLPWIMLLGLIIFVPPNFLVLWAAQRIDSARVGILLMTEKDAVKCVGLTAGETWVLPVEAELSPALIDLILEKLRGRQAA